MSAARDIEDRAARWLIRREEPEWSDADQAELDAWLEESMAHKAAYWRLEYGWREADRIGSLGLRAPALQPASPRRWLVRGWKPIALAASILLMIAVGFRLMPLAPPRAGTAAPEMIATAVGGHKIVPLDDGSQIELNTATVIRAAVTKENRQVWLDKGEAYFEVKHSAEHPFVVYAGPRTITVLGTKFSVRRDGDKVTVSVVEGRVRIDDARNQATVVGSSTVTTGDVAIAQGPSMLVAAKQPEQVEAALAWRDGMLTFDQETLGEAAAEFNRYNKTQLIVTDPAVATIRLGGTFQASNVDAFARLLHDAYGLRITRETDVVKISE